MKTRLLAPALLLAASLCIGPALRAQDGPPNGFKREPKTELAKHMEAMGKAMRVLRNQIADSSQNASSLEQVATIRSEATEASKLTPVKEKDVPEADRAKFMADYQAGMKEFLAAVDKMEADLKANDNTAAVADYKKLGSLEQTDHKEFRKMPPRRGPPGGMQGQAQPSGS
jgi:soluble cytochrome b562